MTAPRGRESSRSKWLRVWAVIILLSGAHASGALLDEPGPTDVATLEWLIDMNATGAGFSSDCEVSPDGNLIYVADSRTGVTGGGVQRWEFGGSSWSLAN